MKKKPSFVTISDTAKPPTAIPELKKMWDAGKALAPDTLLGADGKKAKHLVIMASGIIPDMGKDPLWHCKEFEIKDGEVRGRNVFVLEGRLASFLRRLRLVNSDGTWGPFHVEKKEDHTLVNYALKEGNWWSRFIRDRLRVTPDPDVLIGMFHIRLFGRDIFLGYFFLSRIKEEERPA